MAGLWFNFTSNDIAKLDMVNLQYFHWRLGSDILSKWNFPVVPNTFYLISMLAVWNVTMHCRNDRWAKAQEKQRSCFLQWTMPGKCENSLLPLAPGPLPGIDGNRGKLCNVTSRRLKYSAWVKKTLYIHIYILTLLKNITKGQILQIFFTSLPQVITYWQQQTPWDTEDEVMWP